MTKKQKSTTNLEDRVAELEDRCTGLAARIEWMQIQQTRQPVRTDELSPRQYTAGRWHRRDGNVYGRYTYESSETPYEAWVRRSPPATE